VYVTTEKAADLISSKMSKIRSKGSIQLNVRIVHILSNLAILYIFHFTFQNIRRHIDQSIIQTKGKIMCEGWSPPIWTIWVPCDASF
jgi:hypothetical protein